MHKAPIFTQSALMCPVNSQCCLIGGCVSTPITDVKTAIVTLQVDREQIAHEAA
jgi:hypothetical protein